jgi:hypothetical protein
MWKAPAADHTINSAQAPPFHVRDLLSTHRPVEAMLEIRTFGADQEARCSRIRYRTAYPAVFSKIE